MRPARRGARRAQPLRPSIRVLLLLLVAAIVVPLAAIDAWGAYTSARVDRRDVRARVLGLADITAADTAAFVRRTEATLRTLAGEPGVRALDAGHCDAALGELHRLAPWYANVLTVRADGQPVCAAVTPVPGRPGRASPVDERALVRAIARSTLGKRSFAVLTGGGTAAFAYPLRDEANHVVGAVTLLVNLRAMPGVPAYRGLPPQAALALVTREGAVLARSPGAPRDVGSEVPAGSPAVSGRRGTAEVAGGDGMARIQGFSPVAGTSWIAVASVPLPAAYAGLGPALWRDAVLGGAVAALALAFAMLVSRRIRDPLAGIGTAADEVASGNPAARAAEDGPIELASLSAAVNRALESHARASEALCTSEKRLKSVLEQVADGIFVLTAEHGFRDANAGGLRMLGYERDELLALRLEDVLTQSERRRLARAEPVTTSPAEEVLELTFLRKDGTTFPGEMRTRPICAREYLAIVRDITVQRLTDEARRAAAERFESVFRMAPEALCISEPDSGVLVEVNDDFCRTFEWTRAQALRRSWLELRLLGEPAKRAELLAKLRTGGTVTGFETRMQRRSGEVVEMLINAEQIDFEGRPRVLCMFSDVTERNRAAAALRASEARLRKAQRVAHMGFIDWDLATDRIEISGEVHRLLGIERDSGPATNAEIVAMVHPQDVTYVSECLQQAARGEKTYDIEHRMVRADGSVLWVHAQAELTRDEAGRPQVLFGTIVDVTARRDAEAALRESEARLRLTLEATRIGLWDWDLRADRWYATPMYFQMLGYDQSHESQSRDVWAQRTHPQDVERVNAMMLEVREHGQSVFNVEFRFRHADGSYRWVNSIGKAIEFDAQGRATRMLGLRIDVTERKTNELRLRRSSERFETIFRGSPEAMSIAEVESERILEVNAAFCEVFGRAREEVVGRTSLELGLWEDPRVRRDVFARVRAAERVIGFEGAVRRRSGERLDVLVSADRIEFGDAQCILATFIDVTERKRVETALRESEARLRALSERLRRVQEDERAAIARELHDEIGQSLTALKLGAHGLQSVLAKAEGERLSEVVAIADRTLAVTRDLALNLRPPQLDQLGLAATLRDYLDRLADRAGFASIFAADRDYCDLDREVAVAAFRVAQEALTNVVRHARASKVAIELRTQGDDLLLAVGDDGCGYDLVAARDRALRGGSMGIFGMQERVDFAGGKFMIITRPGQGTRVQATFPLGDAARAKPE